jgi:hypothetical protein
MKFRERDIEIDFTDAVDGIEFDQVRDKTLPNYHGLGKMHRVDFIVELKTAIIFVELKDPSHPRARPENLREFIAELEDGTLTQTFVSKFIDSFFYRWAECKTNKPIHYINLVTLPAELLPNFADEIVKKLPPRGLAVPRWQRPIVQNCQVFNIETWNQNFPKWPVTRHARA